MQATVRSYDPTTRSGTVLTDDGVELSYGAEAFDAAGIRHLRIGQRVQIDVSGVGDDTRVVAMSFYTLH